MSEPFNDRFLRACRREQVDRTPVWFMRQAGRYLPEYRELRGERDILESCKDPALAVEISLQPLRRMELDAAILFSDIMVPLAAVGVPLRIEAGRGPVVDEPIRDESGIARLRPLEPSEDVPEVLEAIRLLRGELSVPLIGFAGAPFTLASYLVEGGPSRNHDRARALMHAEPEMWAQLMERLTGIVLAHLGAQVQAGAQAVQLFDSWAGALPPGDYERHVMPWSRRVMEGLASLEPRVPAIHFGVGTGELLGLMAGAGGDVIGVDWRTPIDIGWERIGSQRGVQGNLDPARLLAGWEATEAGALDVLERAGARDGHVFNLGHGVLPPTDPHLLARLVDLVHERSARG